MLELPKCPTCGENLTYIDGDIYVCPMCSHEWSAKEEVIEEKVWKDANGNILANGDTVTVIKDLKVKGSSYVLKVGTKVKNIRLVDGDHDITCKIDGFGAMDLKSEFLKKIWYKMMRLNEENPYSRYTKFGIIYYRDFL
ncbi:MAG: zinc ribbon domain-containing protein YjdM [Mycoplasmatales bacterium]